jgi:predicted dehydrogenase
LGNGAKDLSQLLGFGVLGTAKIAREKVIPGMRSCRSAAVVAIASRDSPQAVEVAAARGVPRSFGSYEELLADPAVDAVYIPLPNHLHASWAIRALEAGKHVLCEKPIALTAAEAENIAAAAARTGRHVAEAFMFRHHPQWLRARDIIRSGEIGTLRSVHSAFGYHLLDPANVRNRADIGGGALYDIGCYGIAGPRFLFGAEPQQVVAAFDRDPAMGIDRLASAIMIFAEGRHATFACSTQSSPHQRVTVTGTKGRIEIVVPFNPPPDLPTRILVDDGRDPFGGGVREETFAPCDQYALQADAFAEAILAGRAPPYPVTDAIASMRAIDALFRSERSGRWETP